MSAAFIEAIVLGVLELLDRVPREKLPQALRDVLTRIFDTAEAPTSPATPAALAPDFDPQLAELHDDLYAEAAGRVTAWDANERPTEKEVVK